MATAEGDAAGSGTQEFSVAALEDRLARLQRISLDLNSAMSVHDVAEAVIELLDAPFSAPSRSLFLLDDDGETLELVAQRGMPAQAAATFSRLSLDANLPGPVAVRERRTVISRARADAVAEFAPLRDVARSTSGFMAIPLFSDRICIGVLGIGFDESLDARDVAFLEAVAAQVAQSLFRVRLLEREHRRRLELEFLVTLTETALDAIDHVDLMRRVCNAAVPMLGDWCSLHFLPETDVVPEVALAHVDPEKNGFVLEVLRKYPFDPDRGFGVPAVIRSGRTEFIQRLTPSVIDKAVAVSQVSRDDAELISERLGIKSVITVPLRTKRRVVGAMQFVRTDSGGFYDEEDVALAEAVGGRLAEALEAAWMADHQRTVAVSLQQALLPPALPEIAGVDLAARYWPAGIDEVGGDFYDVFRVSDNEWALVIGDVCGTGADAAALTSIARHTIRAAARHGASAEIVMDWLNEAVLQSQRNLSCTVCYATLARVDERWALTSTCAGHPLPIVSSLQRTRPFGRPGTLLGIFDTVKIHPERTFLDAGDVVLLYTDGLTDLPPPHGIDPDELAKLVEMQRPASAATIADAAYRSLVTRLPDRRRRDDAAVLAISIL